MANKRDIQNHLKERLINDHRAWLWSYNDASLNGISPQIVIEKYLLLGNHNEWKLLAEAFPKQLIKQVWIDSGAYSGMNERHYKIASYFFNISNPQKYIARKRGEQIRKLERAY